MIKFYLSFPQGKDNGVTNYLGCSMPHRAIRKQGGKNGLLCTEKCPWARTGIDARESKNQFLSQLVYISKKN